MNEEELTIAKEYNRLKTKRCRERKKATETIKIALLPKKVLQRHRLMEKPLKNWKDNFQNHHPKELKQ